MKRKISERELEDFICQYPVYSLWEGTEIIGRQITLLHGRLDILAWDGKRTLVIELKVRQLEEEDIGQVLRYTHDVRATLQQTAFLTNSTVRTADLTPQEKLLSKAWDYYHGMDSGFHELAVKSILIGTDANHKIIAASREADILIRTWKYDNQNDCIIFGSPEYNKRFFDPDDIDIPEWACQINAKIRETCRDDIAYLETKDQEYWRFIPWRYEGNKP